MTEKQLKDGRQLHGMNGISDLVKSIEILPEFIVLDTMYANSEDSPVAGNNPAALQYEKLAQRFEHVLVREMQIEHANDVRSLPFTSLFSLAEMILYSMAKTEAILLQVMHPVYRGNFIPCHSLNVAFISGMVGMGMGLSYRELNELCVAGLLHDFGMTRIAPQHYFHDGILSVEERAIVETHPMVGYQFFEQLRRDFPWLLRVILEEHRRENNIGYPANDGEELHLYSKIVGLCDTFEALTHARQFRKAFHPADAIKKIIAERNVKFARGVLRAMVDTVSIYPMGGLVQLNNKKIALVIEPVKGSPLRPIIRLVHGAGSNEKENGNGSGYLDRINLTKETTLYITGLVYDDLHQLPPKEETPNEQK